MSPIRNASATFSFRATNALPVVRGRRYGAEDFTSTERLLLVVVLATAGVAVIFGLLG